jgi:hypothetical protein
MFALLVIHFVNMTRRKPRTKLLIMFHLQTRQKLKEAYDIHLAAVIERAEKQTILARHARRLLNYIDDSPVVPGDARQAYDHEPEARQILEDAENDLRGWEPTVEPIVSAAGHESPSHTNGISHSGYVNGLNDVEEHESDVLNETSTIETHNVTAPVESGAPPAKMLVEPAV